MSKQGIFKRGIGVLVIFMTAVTASAKGLMIKNWQQEIHKAPLDEKVNIQIAPLAGDQKMTLYATVLKPGTQVKAHVHHHGTELYHILSGAGEIYTGHLNPESGAVSWGPPQTVQNGDVFAIDAGTVHQLCNTSSVEDLVLIFVCPPSHLKEDRTITADYAIALSGL